jgi:hypothetical protein
MALFIICFVLELLEYLQNGTSPMYDLTVAIIVCSSLCPQLLIIELYDFRVLNFML